MSIGKIGIDNSDDAWREMLVSEAFISSVPVVDFVTTNLDGMSDDAVRGIFEYGIARLVAVACNGYMVSYSEDRCLCWTMDGVVLTVPREVVAGIYAHLTAIWKAKSEAHL